MNFAASGDYRGDGRALQHAIIMQHIDKLTFRPGDEVFDVGCGSGEETKTIASKVKGVVGIDSSEAMIAVASQSNSAPNIEYVVEDARSVGDNPEWRGKFDKVVSFFMLHWIPTEEQPSALGGILSCLKAGGEALFLTDVNDKGPHIISEFNVFLKNHSKWRVYAKDYKIPMYPWNQSMPDTVKLLEEFGCTALQCEIKRQEFPLSKLQVKLLTKTMFGVFDLVPAEQQEEFLEDVWQWTLSHNADESQTAADSVYLHADESVVMHVLKR
ncbi:juvenile hormone acid O-methyltransferase-like [Patiria miniata]|uniref:Methyltransferase domain-containing protein n=1 Tax=Patiria miniata TaxID=46514 RepID=A0A913Z097_PATMI|nr:juvenile hormone acid O-methyltransferase-like [Patiria miniata]XP_038044413.1 juvenile hormone acid O-methyltransferase-like [Patiria miniata]XP_038044414.1 juvenile hormone acid O-methyltransferase-like [Patiria miniata]XP_038044415.1 juvenile hormone acid O-methyltransferase-like [Patiria miniata]XP_038044416.1 juvenile hormone acid O-methyltransferase-like [Patiria miniata]XP_038044418.1 juvenile hormone acid O-methyltransferase-like [Patiria miniata]